MLPFEQLCGAAAPQCCSLSQQLCHGSTSHSPASRKQHFRFWALNFFRSACLLTSLALTYWSPLQSTSCSTSWLHAVRCLIFLAALLSAPYMAHYLVLTGVSPKRLSCSLILFSNQVITKIRDHLKNTSSHSPSPTTDLLVSVEIRSPDISHGAIRGQFSHSLDETLRQLTRHWGLMTYFK